MSIRMKRCSKESSFSSKHTKTSLESIRSSESISARIQVVLYPLLQDPNQAQQQIQSKSDENNDR